MTFDLNALQNIIEYDPQKQAWLSVTPTGVRGRPLTNTAVYTKLLNAGVPPTAFENILDSIRMAAISKAEIQARELEEARAEAFSLVKDKYENLPFLDGRIFNSTGQFVREVVRYHQDKISASGHVHPGLSLNMLVRALNTYQSLMFDLGVEKLPPLSERNIPTSFDAYVEEVAMEKLEALRATLKHRPRCKAFKSKQLARLGKVLTHKDDPYRKIHMIMLEHTMWQVKRKLFGLPVTDHIFLNFYGPKAIGKTTLIRDLLQKPLADVADVFRLHDLMGKFSYNLKQSYYLAIIEELEGMETADQKAFKAFVTSDGGVERVMRSSSAVKFVQNLTFVGSSNRPISDLVPDTSGHLRRYWEINLHHVCKAREVLDWETLNDISREAMDLWRGVDEDSPSPFREFQAEIADLVFEAQESWRRKSPTEEFLQNKLFYPIPPTAAGEWVRVDSLYTYHFKQWMVDYLPGYRVTLPAFRKELEHVPELQLRGGNIEREVFITDLGGVSMDTEDLM